MDTINSVATAASKTIFGDGSDKKEPVSGAKGDVSKGEPYDAGNLDPEDQKKFESTPATPGESKVTDDPVAAATTSDEPEPKGDTTAGQTDPKPEPTNTTDHPEENTLEPTGPGPKPVAQLAAEHGGDAGKAGDESTAAAASGDGAGDKNDDGDKSKAQSGQGTGEAVVHASGLQADGGDFDAKNPGAGQEADRLMEEKGISHEGGEGNGGDKDSGSGTPKKKLSERIKAKFQKK